MSVILRW